MLLVLILRRKLWPMALSGALGGTILYCVFVRILFWIWPDFMSQWSGHGVWGVIVVGLPLGEIVWACTFGAAWPLFAAYAFDARMSGELIGGGNGVVWPRLSRPWW